MMPATPVGKIAALLIAQIATYYATRPPNVPKVEERYKPSRLVALFHQGLVITLCRLSFWLLAIAESATIFSVSNFCPQPLGQLIARLLLRNHPTSPYIGTFSPGFLTGICLALFGSLLRLHCFRILGQFFTFELSIRKDHQLITSGPYSIVRHPAYTGLLCMTLGYVLVVFDRDSWLVASSGLLPHDQLFLTQMLWCLRVIAPLSMGIIVVIRMDSEDAMLERAFGEEWGVWVKKVPYKLIPLVY